MTPTIFIDSLSLSTKRGLIFIISCKHNAYIYIYITYIYIYTYWCSGAVSHVDENIDINMWFSGFSSDDSLSLIELNRQFGGSLPILIILSCLLVIFWDLISFETAGENGKHGHFLWFFTVAAGTWSAPENERWCWSQGYTVFIDAFFDPTHRNCACTPRSNKLSDLSWGHPKWWLSFVKESPKMPLI